MHKLKITNCKNHIEEITLNSGIHTIGRSLDSTLRLESEEVSRMHARLVINSGHCELVDSGSTNGTFLNGNKITSHVLHHGDIIKIGKFNLKFLSDSAKSHTLIQKNMHNKIATLMQNARINFSNIYKRFKHDKNKEANPIRIFDTAHSVVNRIKCTAEHKWVKKITAPALLAVYVALLFLFLHYKTTNNKAIAQLSEMTARYIAESNKEALYLGEYDSVKLIKLPPNVIQAAIWDRNKALRTFTPKEITPIIESSYIGKNETNIIRKNNTFHIYMPIYYESSHVGTLWIVYKL